MRAPLIALALIVPAALVSGCASTGAAALQAEKNFTVAEDSFDAVVKTADNAITSGACVDACAGKVRTLVDTGAGYVRAGRTAVLALDATNIIAETAALTALVPQIAALVNGGAKS